MPAPDFQKKNKHGRGGKRPGAGRKPDEFKIWIQTLVADPKARKRFESILRDEPDADVHVNKEGIQTPTRASAGTYLKAWELAHAYAHGKPVSYLDMGEGEGAVVGAVMILPPQAKGQAGGIKGE